jgi:hypothetical protein
LNRNPFIKSLAIFIASIPALGLTLWAFGALSFDGPGPLVAADEAPDFSSRIRAETFSKSP